MRWDELHTRFTQAMNKRLDQVRYHLGFLPTTIRLIDPERLTYGQFVFSPQELLERTSLIEKYLSSEVTSIVAEADGILQHCFQLLGFENVDYGPVIDWHLDAVHGISAPKKPWFKIPFLDFSEVGDHKIIWELNRHQHLVILAKAWRFTHNDRYIDELIRQWYAWQSANPYPLGINWSSSLEVAFRSLSWLWVHYLLTDCPALPANFASDMYRALALNGRYIERYLSTYFSPNTHLLGEATALFFIGTLCPSIESAGRWRNLGWSTLIAEAQRQVRPDGVYFEQSLYYHVYALDLFLHARLLAARNNVDVLASFDETLQKMSYVLAILSRSGPPDKFGDDDGGRLFIPRRNRAEHLTDPLVVGAFLFRQNGRPSMPVTEEAIWLFGPAAVAATQNTHDDIAISSVAFESSGIYVMASIGGSVDQMTIDAGPQGNANSGHGHADALSVSLSVAGYRWIVDPGTYSYIPEHRDQFRGTSAHNTLQVDGVGQAVPAGAFGWNAIPDVLAETWIAGKTFALFVGSHNGYARLSDPVIHRRLVFHLYDEFWVVIDVAEGNAIHDLEIFWHFASDVSVTKKENAFIATIPSVGAKSSAIQLALLPISCSVWTGEIVQDFVSPAYGRKYPAEILRFSSHAQLPAEHAVLLRKQTLESKSCGIFSRDLGENCQAYAYRYDHVGKSHVMIFAKPNSDVWASYGWSSNARFLYSCLENGRLTHFILCNGSSAHYNGEQKFAQAKPVERFEWFVRDGITEIFSSDEESSRGFKPSF
jgi:hypothetical protein